MQLGDLQAAIANAVIGRTAPSSVALLMSGRNPARRLAVHNRHYTTSLARSLVERFAATVWLAGSELVASAALEFVQEHPPSRPCLAEYGDTFPTYLTTRAEAANLPYLAQFATLDWHLGRLSITVDAAPLVTLAERNSSTLADLRLTLQPGTEYVRLDWPLDELMSFYLSGSYPDQYALRREPVRLELRGCRGDLSMTRLTESDFAFRRAIARGGTLTDAASRAIPIDDRFDPGPAVLKMLRTHLVIGALLAEAGQC